MQKKINGKYFEYLSKTIFLSNSSRLKMDNGEEKFLLPYYSREQKWIITRKLNGDSYSKICSNWPFKDTAVRKTSSPKQKKGETVLYNQNVISCIRRSAMGYIWSKGMSGGAEMYLCPQDLENLKVMICSAARDLVSARFSEN